MNLSADQRHILSTRAFPRLAEMGLRREIDRHVDPEDGVSTEDCLYVFGSSEGPYLCSKRVGAVLMEIDGGFAGLLIMKATDAEP